MKFIILLILIFNLLFSKNTSDYYINYFGVNVAKIENIETLENGFLVAKPTVFQWFLKKDKYILYSKDKPKIIGDNKYKKDNYSILKMLKILNKKRYKKQKIESKKYKLIVNCSNNYCKYIRIYKKNKMIKKGYIKYKNNKLIEMYDEYTNVKIKLKN